MTILSRMIKKTKFSLNLSSIFFKFDNFDNFVNHAEPTCFAVSKFSVNESEKF